jgi:hypothetical protein
MDISKLERNPEKVHAYLKELPDMRLVTTKGVKMLIPSRYAERGLAQIGVETYIVGICAIVVDDKYYALLMVNAMVRVEPTSSMKIMIDEDEYYEFYFEPGSTVMSSLLLVKTDTLVYKIYDEIFSKGRVPWYMTYQDMGKLFDTAVLHAGANVGKNHEVTELLVSLIARDENDRHKFFRQTLQSAADLKKKKPAVIPLRSVTYAATNTTNKLAGSYFHDGVVSALNSPSERVERIEGVLRR